ncbi:hypothetical protein A6S26_03580 [Nostoc sp. ATCC 43529]|nr:hypothetical protein A6S26_03580 [Nostoc sp. ATCC 43529]
MKFKPHYIYFFCLALIVTLIFYSGYVPASAQNFSKRDAAYWPFATNSPWNMPIGSKAKFEPVSSPQWTTNALKYGFIINSTDYTIPVYIATYSDPIRKVYRTDNKTQGYVAFQQRVPDSAKPSPGGDAHLAIIDQTHSYVTEMLRGKRRSDGNLEAPFPNKIDLRGTGIFKDYHGSCAYGGSCIAGLIRKGEIKTGINHALRISITTAVLNKNAPAGKPYVWPANTADDGDGRSYKGTGNVYMGSLLAIPPNVNIEEIASKGTPAYNLAKALQDYGAYVVDRGHLNLYAEPTAKDEVKTLMYNSSIPKYLQVVVNNSPSSVGGGGKRRRPLAPPV